MNKYIRYEDIESYVEARDHVVQAADRWADSWANGPGFPRRGLEEDLLNAVYALRSLHADRGVRDPSPPGEQEPDAEPEHGQAVHPGGQP